MWHRGWATRCNFIGLAGGLTFVWFYNWPCFWLLQGFRVTQFASVVYCLINGRRLRADVRRYERARERTNREIWELKNMPPTVTAAQLDSRCEQMEAAFNEHNALAAELQERWCKTKEGK